MKFGRPKPISPKQRKTGSVIIARPVAKVPSKQNFYKQFPNTERSRPGNTQTKSRREHEEYLTNLYKSYKCYKQDKELIRKEIINDELKLCSFSPTVCKNVKSKGLKSFLSDLKAHSKNHKKIINKLAETMRSKEANSCKKIPTIDKVIIFINLEFRKNDSKTKVNWENHLKLYSIVQ